MYIPNAPSDMGDKAAMKAAHAAVRAQEGRSMPFVAECLCCVCGMPASFYHHESYAWDDRLKLVPMCGSCHQLLHRIGRNGLIEARISKLTSEIDSLYQLLNDVTVRQTLHAEIRTNIANYAAARERLMSA